MQISNTVLLILVSESINGDASSSSEVSDDPEFRELEERSRIVERYEQVRYKCSYHV